MEKSVLEILLFSWLEIRGDLDLSKEVLWVSVCQRAAELSAGKVGGLKKILPCGPARVSRSRTRLRGRIFFQTSNFARW